MGNLILVTGGARSGKSTFAEQLIRDAGEPVLYIATAVGFDVEMRERIAKHRQQRPPTWDTWEGYRNLKAVFNDTGPNYRSILLDCVTLCVSNWLLQETEIAVGEWDTVVLDQIEQAILADLREFLDETERRNTKVVMVTNEVGCGIVPENKLARVFRDVAGRVNQVIATRASTVYLIVCGQPLRIK
ncbi:MAG TPA: bifunctional adenosylcobinamide kinase/adenosylcobinamide-phosphate guanylyltransferase [Bacillota bacterium]|nr:bifunctional adenosylcobinamide kinase/adenosylcobinamide-phosphate guanylyltransferase [Bacillota bacterium]